jgi:endonuclease/exonuclease/phosphatase family metal-dependent hydrolase
VELRALTWNLFHGRDWPAAKELQIRKGRISSKPIPGETHVQVNRDLWAEFTGVLDGQAWDLALLQECPPRWRPGFARVCEAEAHRVLTSRNWFLPFTAPIARMLPDLLGSSEGGSNLTLIRKQWLEEAGGEIAERRTVVLTRRPERRVMALTRLESGFTIGNLHASTSPPSAERELVYAAQQLIEAAGEDKPVLLGGDFNVRPAKSPVFIELEERFGLAQSTAPDAIDNLLVRNLEIAEAPHALAPEKRDVIDGGTGLHIRLSDHDIVTARFEGAGL